MATAAWVVGLFGFVWGPPVLGLVGAAVLIATVAVVARLTGRGLLALGVSVVVPVFALLFLSRL